MYHRTYNFLFLKSHSNYRLGRVRIVLSGRAKMIKFENSEIKETFKVE